MSDFFPWPLPCNQPHNCTQGSLKFPESLPSTQPSLSSQYPVMRYRPHRCWYPDNWTSSICGHTRHDGNVPMGEGTAQVCWTISARLCIGDGLEVVGKLILNPGLEVTHYFRPFQGKARHPLCQTIPRHIRCHHFHYVRGPMVVAHVAWMQDRWW